MAEPKSGLDVFEGKLPQDLRVCFEGQEDAPQSLSAAVATICEDGGAEMVSDMMGVSQDLVLWALGAEGGRVPENGEYEALLSVLDLEMATVTTTTVDQVDAQLAVAGPEKKKKRRKKSAIANPDKRPEFKEFDVDDHAEEARDANTEDDLAADGTSVKAIASGLEVHADELPDEKAPENEEEGHVSMKDTLGTLEEAEVRDGPLEGTVLFRDPIDGSVIDLHKVLAELLKYEDAVALLAEEHGITQDDLEHWQETQELPPLRAIEALAHLGESDFYLSLDVGARKVPEPEMVQMDRCYVLKTEAYGVIPVSALADICLRGDVSLTGKNGRLVSAQTILEGCPQVRHLTPNSMACFTQGQRALLEQHVGSFLQVLGYGLSDLVEQQADRSSVVGKQNLSLWEGLSNGVRLKNDALLVPRGLEPQQVTDYILRGMLSPQVASAFRGEHAKDRQSIHQLTHILNGLFPDDEALVSGEAIDAVKESVGAYTKAEKGIVADILKSIFGVSLAEDSPEVATEKIEHVKSQYRVTWVQLGRMMKMIVDGLKDGSLKKPRGLDLEALKERTDVSYGGHMRRLLHFVQGKSSQVTGEDGGEDRLPARPHLPSIWDQIGQEDTPLRGAMGTGDMPYAPKVFEGTGDTTPVNVLKRDKGQKLSLQDALAELVRVHQRECNAKAQDRSSSVKSTAHEYGAPVNITFAPGIGLSRDIHKAIDLSEFEAIMGEQIQSFNLDSGQVREVDGGFLIRLFDNRDTMSLTLPVSRLYLLADSALGDAVYGKIDDWMHKLTKVKKMLSYSEGRSGKRKKQSVSVMENTGGILHEASQSFRTRVAEFVVSHTKSGEPSFKQARWKEPTYSVI